MATTIEPNAQPQKQSAFRRVLLPTLIVIVGVLVMVYPVVSSVWNNHAQQQVAREYEALMEQADPVELDAMLESAREYNESKAKGPILDPWLAHVDSRNPEYQEYLKELSGKPAMSQVTIPAIDSSLPLYHGTDADTLQRGLGHLFGTSLPVGGETTHSVLTGHTGITNATLWDNLKDVVIGDEIFISTFGEKLKYEVYDLEVVTPDQTDSLATIEGEDIITLITCTPYGINTHRLLVHAKRVPYVEETDAEKIDKVGMTMQWWMWVVIAIAVLILGALLWWLLRNLKKNRDEAAEEDVDADELSSGNEEN